MGASDLVRCFVGSDAIGKKANAKVAYLAPCSGRCAGWRKWTSHFEWTL